MDGGSGAASPPPFALSPDSEARDVENVTTAAEKLLISIIAGTSPEQDALDLITRDRPEEEALRYEFSMLLLSRVRDAGRAINEAEAIKGGSKAATPVTSRNGTPVVSGGGFRSHFFQSLYPSLLSS